jgi:hypothetical protein
MGHSVGLNSKKGKYEMRWCGRQNQRSLHNDTTKSIQHTRIIRILASTNHRSQCTMNDTVRPDGGVEENIFFLF